MQPVVGVLSDRCTSRMGRRRPFLIVGVAAVVLSFLCLGWCKEIMTTILGSDYSKVRVHHKVHSPLMVVHTGILSSFVVGHLLDRNGNNIDGSRVDLHSRLCHQLW